jgi:membrane associated rhomboid family serine protease
MFGLWMFGRDVESVYGRKEFLWMYLLTAVLGGLVFVLRSMAVSAPDDWPFHRVVGASGAVTAVTLLYCLHFPKRTILLMMILPVPAWAVGMMIIVGNIVMMFNSSEPVAFDVHLVGAAFAIGYFKFGWRVSSWVPSLRLLQKVGRDGIDSLTKSEQRKLEAYSRRMKQKHR